MKRGIGPELFQQAVAASQDGLVIADARLPDMPLIYVNPAFERLTGYRANEVVGHNCRFLQADDTNQEGLDAIRVALREGSSCVATLRNYRKDGSMFWNELSLGPIRDRAGQITHIVGTLSDVTARVQAEHQLLQKQQRLERTKRMLEGLALKDGLTGLYNRRYFSEQLLREWNRARRDEVPLSLFMIDIDHFKRFNDTYGHLAGDRCIRTVGEAVQRWFARGSDLVARYGGEEFVVLTTGVERRQARERAEALRQMIRQVEVEGTGRAHSPSVTVSVGLASAIPEDGIRPEDLLAAADRALYQAKRQGRDRIAVASSPRTLAHAA